MLPATHCTIQSVVHTVYCIVPPVKYQLILDILFYQTTDTYIRKVQYVIWYVVPWYISATSLKRKFAGDNEVCELAKERCNKGYWCYINMVDILGSQISISYHDIGKDNINLSLARMFGVRKLNWLGCRVIKNVWWYVKQAILRQIMDVTDGWMYRVVIAYIVLPCSISFNCLFPACRACDYVYIDYVRRSRSSSCRLLCPINCQTYITCQAVKIIRKSIMCDFCVVLMCGVISRWLSSKWFSSARRESNRTKWVFLFLIRRDWLSLRTMLHSWRKARSITHCYTSSFVFLANVT